MSQAHAKPQVRGYRAGSIIGAGDVARYRPSATVQPVPDREPLDDRERRGRVAYEASCERLRPWFPEPIRWVDLPPLCREAWGDAAEAARAAP